MAVAYKKIVSAALGTAPVTLGTVPTGKVWILIDISCANTDGLVEVKGTVRTIAGGITAHLIKAGPIPVGGAMVVVGAPRKVVMEVGDQLVAFADKVSAFDIAVSYIEQDA